MMGLGMLKKFKIETTGHSILICDVKKPHST